MDTTIRRAAGLLAIAALAAACSDNSATGPGDGGGGGGGGGGNATYDLAVTLNSIIALDLCEEFGTDLDGGEFTYKFVVTWPNNSQATVHETESYPTVSKHVKLSHNQPRSIAQNRTFTSGGSGAISIVFRATEVDFDLFGGNPRADSRMNDQSVSAQHAFSSGSWQTGDFTAVINPANGCRLRANYNVSAVAQ